MTKYGEWRIWNGGECPVDPDTKVQVQTACQSRSYVERRDWTGIARQIDWLMTTHRSSTIIAYRVVKEPMRETRKHECWVGVYEESCPMLSDSNLTGFTHGVAVQDIVDGKPVRIVWEADQ